MCKDPYYIVSSKWISQLPEKFAKISEDLS